MSGNTPKEPRYYNLATLYQCLYGQLDGITLNNSSKEEGSDQELLDNFVKLFVHRDNRAKNEDMTSEAGGRKDYFAGIFNKKARRGAVPDFVKKNAKNPDNCPLTDDEWHDDFIGFFFDYCTNNLQENYFELLETAMDLDGNVAENTINNIRDLHKAASDSYEWFMAAYLAALVPYPNYFGEDKDENEDEDIDHIEKNKKRKKEHIYTKKYKEIKAEAEKRYKDRSFINPADKIPPPQYNLTKRYRRIAKEYFERVRHSGRFEYYSLYQGEKQDSYIHDVTVTLTQGDNDSLSLENIVFHDRDISKCTDSVSLCGKGGIGKTFLLLNMIDTILSSDEYADIIPFYIELHTVDNGSPKLDVQTTLADELNDTLDDGCTRDELTAILKNAGSRVIIFADGMNEVIGTDKRNQIARSITRMRDKYNTRFCISSRENHVEQFNKMAQCASGRFKEALVNELNGTQIQDYLDSRRCNISYKALPPATQVLLRTPQGVSMYSELVKKEPQKEHIFRNLGELILEYSDMILEIPRDDPEPDDILFEDALMEIAYKWVNESKFQNEIAPEQLKTLNTKKNIKSIFMPKRGGREYTFSHQNFRDVYCARFLAKKIKEICDIYSPGNPTSYTYNDIADVIRIYFDPKNNIVPKNDEILQLVSAFVAEGKREYDREAIRVIGEFDPQNMRSLEARFLRFFDGPTKLPTLMDFMLSVLIKIFAFRSESGISIAGLDLSGLDLRNISLSGYELYNAKTGESTIFDGCKLSVDTFRKQGLQTSAQVIVKYKQKRAKDDEEKEYIAAFAESSAVVIDTTTGLHETVLYESNGGVECCCLSEENGHPAIYLGNRKGCVTVFLPHMLDIDKKNALQIRVEELDKKEAITSICEITHMGKKYLLFSTADGTIYLRKKYSAVRRKKIKFRLTKSNRVYGISPPRLVPYEKHNMVIASFDNKVYMIPFDHIFLLSENSDEVYTNEISFVIKDSHGCYSPYEIEYNIHDIALCGDHLFINTVSEIRVFKLDAGKNKACTFPEARLLQPDISDAVRFTYFSPCDTKKGEIKVITGLSVVISVHETNDIKRFYELTYDEHTEKVTCNGFADTFCGSATWTGVKYKSGTRTFFASVSNNNDVEIDCLDDENFPRTVIRGAYNGIRSMDAFTDNTNVLNNIILCGLYDGNVIAFSYDTNMIFELGLNVKHVYPLHEDIVEKVLYIGNGHFLSCGRDGRLILTRMSDHEKKVLLFCHEPLTDFCLDKDMNIWAISNKKVYRLQRRGSGWDEAQISVPAGFMQLTLHIYAITIDDINDSPIIFFHDDFDKGHVVKVANERPVTKDGKTVSEFEPIDVVELDTPTASLPYPFHPVPLQHPFICKMKYYDFQFEGKSQKTLIVAGNIGNSGYVMIANVDEFGNCTPTEHSYCIERSFVNDFDIMRQSSDRYIIMFAHEDNTLSFFSLDYNRESKNYVINASEHTILSSEPICIKQFDNEIVCGAENGIIYHLDFVYPTSSDPMPQVSTYPRAPTYANLLSSKNVKLLDCTFDDSNEFYFSLKGYFDIDITLDWDIFN